MNFIKFLITQRDSLEKSKKLSKDILQTMLAIDNQWIYTDVGKNTVLLTQEIDKILSNIEYELSVQTGPRIFYINKDHEK